MGGLPMTYDLEVILKYCGISSYDIKALIPGCPWRWSWSLRSQSWTGLGASVGGLGLLLWPSPGGLGRSWGHLGPILGHLGQAWSHLGTILGRLEERKTLIFMLFFNVFLQNLIFE